MIPLPIDFPCFIFTFPVDRPLVYINDFMIKKLGYDSSEVIAKLRYEDLLTRGSQIFYKTHFHPILMIEKRVEEVFLSFKSKKGKEYPVLMNLSLNVNEDVASITGVGLPIVKRNKYEKGILEAKRAAENALMENELLIQTKATLVKSRALLEHQVQKLEGINQEQIEFNKILTHDLQEPIRKIQIFASQLEDSSTLKDLNVKSRRCLQRIYEISAYGHRLLRRLQGYHALAYYKNDYLTANLETVVESALKKVDIEAIKPDYHQLNVHEIYGDIPQLTRLFSELLLNSYLYRSSDRPLSIKISSERIKNQYILTSLGDYEFLDFIRITIRDNAMGFPAYAEKVIFKPLQKLNNAHGKGLGLAYCKKIVELHNGSITMSPIKSGGSEFTILLPTKCTLKAE